jgi:hypothetical protein
MGVLSPSWRGSKGVRAGYALTSAPLIRYKWGTGAGYRGFSGGLSFSGNSA